MNEITTSITDTYELTIAVELPGAELVFGEEFELYPYEIAPFE